MLVVMDPMRSLGQALDAVEAGHVVALGLGELGAEVPIALSPDDQRGRRDRANLRLGFLRPSHRGAVVVDDRGRRAWLRPRLDVAVDLLRRVRRAGVALIAPEE